MGSAWAECVVLALVVSACLWFFLLLTDSTAADSVDIRHAGILASVTVENLQMAVESIPLYSKTSQVCAMLGVASDACSKPVTELPVQSLA